MAAWQSDAERLEQEVERWRTSHEALLQRSLRVDASDEIIAQMAYTYSSVYEEMRDPGPFSEDDPAWTVEEAKEEACRQTRRVLQHYLLTGEVKHWRDVPAPETVVRAD